MHLNEIKPWISHHISTLFFTVTSHEHRGVSIYWQLDCLFNNLLKLTTKKTKTMEALHYLLSMIEISQRASNMEGVSTTYLIMIFFINDSISWWRHQMETFSALLAFCAGNSPVPGEFPAQRPVTRSFDIFFDLRPNKQLSKQLWGWWIETPSCSLWRHCNVYFWLGWVRQPMDQ